MGLRQPAGGKLTSQSGLGPRAEMVRRRARRLSVAKVAREQRRESHQGPRHAEHKFKIGQVVFFRPKPIRGIGAPANQKYRITQLLPASRGQPQYQIRCEETQRNFAASEREL